VPDADEYELAVYGVDQESGHLDFVQPVLEARIRGSATSWTPSAVRCFPITGRFAWSVRVNGESWPTPILFTVDATSQFEQLKRALREILNEMADEGRLAPEDLGSLERRLDPASRLPDTVAPGGRGDGPGPAPSWGAPPESTAAINQRERAVAEARLRSRGTEAKPRSSETDGAPEHAVAKSPGPDAALGQDLRLEGEDVLKVWLDSLDSASTGADLLMYNNDGTLMVQLDSQDGPAGAFLQMYARDIDGSGSQNTVILDADASANSAELRLRGQPVGGGTTVQTVRLRALDSLYDGSVLEMWSMDGQNTLVMSSSEGGGDGAMLQLYKADGTLAIDLDAELSAGGDARVTTEELLITGGSDISEQFTIVGGVAPEAGMVVAIDLAGDGGLRLSRHAYDRSVAGVVSGAGELEPGLMMGQRGTLADGEVAVALAGRVYVWADADPVPIRPGDLLTTSDTPGHAMRVADPERAHGAILGKALTGLESGKGLVLALVALQ
jgi:hypothetical protein